jgi:hypothetical protein
LFQLPPPPPPPHSRRIGSALTLAICYLHQPYRYTRILSHVSAVGLLDSAVEGSTVLQKHINTGSRCSLTASLQSLSDLLVTKCSAV